MKTNDEKRYHIKRSVIMKASSLLNMDYMPDELAEELGVTGDYVRKVLIRKMGAPHKWRGATCYWINGEEFKKWVTRFEKKSKHQNEKNKMREDQFYCLKCRKVVEQSLWTIKKIQATTYIQSFCPYCHTRINKFLGKDK